MAAEEKMKDMDSGQNPEFPTMVSDDEDDEYEDKNDDKNVEDQYPHGRIEWKIEHFADIPVLADERNNVNFILSQSMKTGDVEWGIKLFPYGWVRDVVQENDFISIFCEIRNDPDVVKGRKTKYGRFTIEFMNHRDPLNTEPHTASHTFNKQALDQGWQPYFNRKKLLDPEAGFIGPDGSLTVIAQFWRMPDPVAESLGSNYWKTDYRKETGYVGLRNQGATCYMNSLLQTLYHTSAFARAVFMLPTENDDPTKSVPLALQRVFFGLKYAPSAVSTKELTQSFGWDSSESFQQHDVQELNRVLTEKLEDKMRGTPAEGLLANLLSGTIEHKIHCTKVDFDSCREETFYDLSVDVKDCRDLLHSLDKYTEVEMLDGDNMYFAEQYGKQPAEKGCKFLKLPPVLHLQLKRWVFDWETGRSCKVNDKFDFPLTLDLERYVSDKAPKDQSTIYELHAVLIHSGNAGGGHYYLFQRPTPKNKWFLFNDERVTPVGVTSVMEEGFGGEQFSYESFGKHYTGIAKPNTSAYMLVYIRKTDVHNVLFHLHSRDIPYHLHRRFASDAAQADIQKKEEAQANVSKFIRFVTEKDFASSDIKRDLFNADLIVPQNFPNETTLAALYKAAADKFEVDVSRVYLYPFEKRENQTNRIIPCLPISQSTTLSKISWKRFDVFVLIKPAEQAAVADEKKEEKHIMWDMIAKPKTSRVTNLEGTQILLFVKQYNPKTEKLDYVGIVPADTTHEWCETLAALKKIVGVPDDGELYVYDDRTSNQRIDSGNPHGTLKTLHLRHGDILVVQTPPASAPAQADDVAPKFPLYTDFLYYTTNLVTVKFVPLSTEDSKYLMFQLRLPQTMPYKDVLQNMASHLKVEASHIRLTRYNVAYRCADAEPYKNSSAPPLNLILGLDTYYKSDCVFYEVLDITTEEAENMTEVRFKFFDDHVKCIGEHMVRMQLNERVADVLVKVQEMHPSNKEAGGSGKYRFCEVVGSRIKVLDPSLGVLDLKSASKHEYRVEEIPEDEETADKEKGAVVVFTHYEPNFSGQADFFGDPFFQYVPYGKSVSDMRAVIQAKLGLEEGVVKAMKFSLVDGLKPTNLTERDTVVSEKGLPKGVVIGLMHSRPRDVRPKKSNRSYVSQERAIVINM